MTAEYHVKFATREEGETFSNPVFVIILRKLEHNCWRHIWWFVGVVLTELTRVS